MMTRETKNVDFRYKYHANSAPLAAQISPNLDSEESKFGPHRTSLGHFWRLLFGHFPKTVVQINEKGPTKSTSTPAPMANSLPFWRRPEPCLQPVPPLDTPRRDWPAGCQDSPATPNGITLAARVAARQAPIEECALGCLASPRKGFHRGDLERCPGTQRCPRCPRLSRGAQVHQ